jgi:hypothetical protein
MSESLKKNYEKAVKITAKENNKSIIDYAEHAEISNSNNVYSKIKNGCANGLVRAIDPLKFFGAKVEVKITCSSGKIIIIK